MAKSSPTQTSFTGGEWAPELYGRVDLAKYATACRRLLNVIPLRQGPAMRRPGWRNIVQPGKSLTGQIATFVPTADSPYLLVFSSTSLSIYLLSTGSDQSATFVQTLTTPWDAADITDSSGRFRLSMVQSADVMYIASGTRTVRKLSRTSPTTFTLTEPTFKGGPWLPQNTDQARTIHASASTGTITLTASAATFTAADVGRLVRLELKDLTTIKPWEAGQKTPVLAVNDLRRSDGKTYKAVTVAAGTAPAGGTTLTYIRTGGSRPTHTFGRAWDGDQTTEITTSPNYISTGVEWEFQDPGYGVARITAFTSSTVVTAVVESAMPAGVVGASNATWRWELGAWGGDLAYPDRVCFFRERLCFARGFNVWLSVAGDFENFEDREFGEVLPDSAFGIEVLRDQANAIAWIKPLDAALIVGTRSGVFAAAEQNTSDPLGPANVAVKLQAGYGCDPVEPVQVGNSILFVQSGGTRIRELIYSADSANYIAPDQSILAGHTIAAGVRQMAYAAEPWSIVWLRTGDGQMVAMTWDKEQEIVAFSPQQTTGATTSSIAACAAEARDLQLRLAIITNESQRSLDVLAWEAPAASVDTRLYSDCGVIAYDWDADGDKWIVGGLDHLQGQTVQVVIDGATHPARQVTQRMTFGWSIELDRQPTSYVAVGLPYQTVIEPLRLEAGASDGTAQGRIKKIAQAIIRYLNAQAFRVGRSDADLSPATLRRPSFPMDQGMPLLSGDYRAPVGGYDEDATIVIESSEPLPMTVSAIIYDVQTERA